MSLRTGGRVATTESFIINPNNLKIEGFYCQDNFSKDRLILLTQDVRDTLEQGLVVNDHDVLSHPDDLVRLQQILQLNFELLNKPVCTSDKRRLGKVSDFAIESKSMYIQKLYVGQSILKSFNGGQLSVDRTQIIEITSKRVVINDPLQLKPASGLRAPIPTTS